MTDTDKTGRRYTRILHDSRARIIGTSQDWQCRLIDISLNGVLLERPTDWQGSPADRFALEIELDGADDSLALRMEVAVVAHIEDACIGFKCLDIDIDSISHLKRLLELNLGDPALLQRELDTLLETHSTSQASD